MLKRLLYRGAILVARHCGGDWDCNADHSQCWVWLTRNGKRRDFFFPEVAPTQPSL